MPTTSQPAPTRIPEVPALPGEFFTPETLGAFAAIHDPSLPPGVQECLAFSFWRHVLVSDTNAGKFVPPSVGGHLLANETGSDL